MRSEPDKLRSRVVQSIADIGRDRWNALYPDELERFDYLLAVERAKLPGFEWFYVTVDDGRRLVAAAPAFMTVYALDTTLTGAGKAIVRSVQRIFKGAFRLRLACLGSPCTETALLQMAPDLSSARRSEVQDLVIGSLRQEAARRHCGLLAVKDLPAPLQPTWAGLLKAAGFGSVPGMAGAHLAMNFNSVDDYMATLSSGSRKDMRRKLRAGAKIRIERRPDVADVLDEVMALYAETLSRADLQFEELTPAYFKGVLDVQDCTPSCVLYFADDELLAANLMLENEHTLLDKFFCMKAKGRAFNLYFVSWFENIRYCIEKGLKTYYSGQAGYKNKTRLGSALTPASMYFRHRNAVINAALQVIAPLVVSDLEA
jgi:uncharacterized protein